MISTWGVKYGGTRHLRKQPYGNLISLPTSSLRKIKCPMYSQYILPAPFSASPAGNFDRSHFHHGLFQVQLRKLLPSTKIAHEDFSHGKLVPKMCPKWYSDLDCSMLGKKVPNVFSLVKNGDESRGKIREESP